MEFYLFPDVYADRYLVDTYVISFRLKDRSCVRTVEWQGKQYIREVPDWEAFKRGAYQIVLYECGEEIARFSDIETALSEAYRMACLEASKRLPKVIEPALGLGNPPPEVVRRVFPLSYKPLPFPEDLKSFLEDVVKSVEVETIEWEKVDDDEIPF
ncbi:MAG: hypothetical protein NZ560_03460 [Aquificaceae bacterium]|nr:hypothetical protein [Aquificaceae bacterium]MDW8096750.1 hypothetical protein [Aquificaceae bacterium]